MTITKEARAELRAILDDPQAGLNSVKTPVAVVVTRAYFDAAPKMSALLDELDAAEAENERLREQRDANRREKQAAVQYAFEEGQQVERERAEGAEATIARLTAEVTEEEVDRVAVYKNDLWTGYDFVDPVPTLTAFIEGRKGGSVSPDAGARDANGIVANEGDGSQ